MGVPCWCCCHVLAGSGPCCCQRRTAGGMHCAALGCQPSTMRTSFPWLPAARGASFVILPSLGPHHPSPGASRLFRRRHCNGPAGRRDLGKNLALSLVGKGHGMGDGPWARAQSAGAADRRGSLPYEISLERAHGAWGWPRRNVQPPDRNAVGAGGGACCLAASAHLPRSLNFKRCRGLSRPVARHLDCGLVARFTHPLNPPSVLLPARR